MKKRMMRVLTFLVLLNFSGYLFAETVTPAPVPTQPETYYNFMYKVEEEDNLAIILRKFVKPDSIIYKNTPLVGKIFKNNPQIKDWKHLIPGQIISLYIPQSMIDGQKYIAFSSEQNKKNAELKKMIQSKISTPEGFKGSLFYMASIGDFNQTSTQGTTVSYNQNSYGTFGYQANYYPKNTPYSVSSSAYVSVFTPATAALPPYRVTLPSEIGFNAYGEYLWQKKRVTWHGGVDYEKFSSFNFTGIEEDQKVYLDRISVIYLTAGASYVFSVFNLPLYTKVSLSKSVVSSTSTEFVSSAGTAKAESLSGMKALFYLNYKFTDKFFFHSMLKYHKMSGPSDLTSVRLGVGVGYILF
jgi:hypothetical protein